MLRQVKRTVALVVGREVAGGDQLPEQRPPFDGRRVGADAVDGELVVPVARDALVGLARQHVDHVLHAEALARPVDGGQRLARHLRAVDGGGRG